MNWSNHLRDFFGKLQEKYNDVAYFNYLYLNIDHHPINELLETYIQFNRDVFPMISKTRLDPPTKFWQETMGKKFGLRDIIWYKQILLSGYQREHIMDNFDIDVSHSDYLYIYAVWTKEKIPHDIYYKTLDAFKSLLNNNTMDYFMHIKPPNNKRLDKLSDVVDDLFQSHTYKFNSCIFGSCTLALYNIVNQPRPRDLDMWINFNHVPNIKYIKRINEQLKGALDIYDTQSIIDTASMTERHFNFFQGMLQAPLGTRYDVAPSSVKYIDKEQVINKQKFQKRPRTQEIMFHVKAVSDILYNPRLYIYWHGHKFLALIPEMIRKHLRYLENLKIIPKDIEDFERTRELINKQEIRYMDWSSDELLNFIGLDNNIDVPIFVFNVDVEDMGKKIRKPDREINKHVAMYIKKNHPDMLDIIFSANDHFQVPLTYRITHGAIDRYIYTFTHKNDITSMVGFNHEHVFRNILFNSLPKSPINSVFGPLPSTWLWALTEQGMFDVVLVTNGLELFNKHVSLINFGNIVMSGECYIDRDGAIWINIDSGSFQNQYIDILGVHSKHTYKRLLTHIIRYEASHDRLMKGKRTLNVVNFKLLPFFYPSKGEFAFLCQKDVAYDRMLTSPTTINKIFISDDEFEKMKDGVHLCDQKIKDYLFGYDYMISQHETLIKKPKYTTTIP